MDVQVIDRANGKVVEIVPLAHACLHLAEVFDVMADDVRKQLLSGVPVRTTGFHYEMTEIALERYRAAKLEAEYDRIAMQ